MSKIYVGNGKKIQTQYGEMTKVSMHKDDINRIVSFMKAENSDWVNFLIKERKEPSKSGSTLYLEIDQNKPKPSSPAPAPVQDDDTLPF